MKLTVDANVFFAALIRDGLARSILFHPDLEWYAPEFLLNKYKKYKSELLTKSRLKAADFDFSVSKTLGQIELIPPSQTDVYALPVSKLVSDAKDWPYLACALFVGSDIVSEDPHLHSQRRVKVYPIESLARNLNLIF